jgi:2-polyprenyl-3-methyl-5-hydroxy-6-metoxy-1,4-benzoquinol methylase
MNNSHTDFNAKIYWESRLKENYGLQSVGFLGLGKHYNKWLYKVRHKVFFRVIKSLNLDFSTMDILDVGSGTGFYVEKWKQLGVRTVAGSDLTNIAVEKLKKRYPTDRFYQLDIGDTLTISSIQHQQYDIVSAFDVLYHIVDDNRYRKAIENIYNLVRPKGLFIISDNFLHNRAERGTHQVSRSLEDIERLLHATGFEIVSRIPMFILMNYPVDSNSNFRKLLWKAAILFPVVKSEVIGYPLGASLYPMELILTSVLKESPTTEVMVCRKS